LTFTLNGEPRQVDQNLFRQFLSSLPNPADSSTASEVPADDGGAP
jgi:hypothetical protein